VENFHYGDTKLANKSVLLTGLLALALAGCGEISRLDIMAGTGSDPQLPEPVTTLIPTVNVAKAVGWQASQTPVAAEGLQVNAFTANLDHPRWLYQLPNGDVLVAETNFQMQGLDKSIKGKLTKHYLQKAGAYVPSADRISLLRDADGDGVAEVKTTFLANLHSPFGMSLIGDTFYVANADSIVTFPYKAGDAGISSPPQKLIDLPGQPLNYHWTKNILASEDGSRLYVTVSSNSNIGENGMEIEEGRAAIWEVDTRTGGHRIFASGLRNPNGLAWEPVTKALWTVVNERDELGSDLVPDYMTSVKEGGFYGWPYSYFGQHVDKRVQPQRPELVAQALVPNYALGPHTASLGLADATGNRLGARFEHGMFVGQHGSWNRRPYSGYKVIFIPFAQGKPNGAPIDVLTGFIEGDNARGRPVGVIVDQSGALLVADDVGNTVWRVSAR
jgi:glucose/arabinose dehydrogenase